MIYKVNEYVYLKKNKYTFKEQLFLNNNNRLVYCFVVVKNGATECLLQSLFNGFKKEEKDKAIKDYLADKIKALECGYSTLSANAKDMVELVSYKRVK